MRGELRPGGSEREWCDVEVLRRLRRASLAALRKEIEPADSGALAAFLPSWQGIDRHAGAGAGVDRLREVLVPLQGLALPAEIWERDVLPRRTGAYSQAWLDALCASGEVVWVGAGALGRSSGRVALYFREDAPAIGPPPRAAPRRARRPASAERRPSTSSCARGWRAGPASSRDLLAELEVAAGGAPRGALGSRVGGRGDERRLGAAARAAPDAGARRARPRRASPSRSGPRAVGARRARARRARPARRHRSRAAGR